MCSSDLRMLKCHVLVLVIHPLKILVHHVMNYLLCLVVITMKLLLPLVHFPFLRLLQRAERGRANLLRLAPSHQRMTTLSLGSTSPARSKSAENISSLYCDIAGFTKPDPFTFAGSRRVQPLNKRYAPRGRRHLALLLLLLPRSQSRTLLRTAAAPWRRALL